MLSRNYAYSDADMIRASLIIARNFKNHIYELTRLQEDWTKDYASGLIRRIEDIKRYYLGLYPKKDLVETANRMKTILKYAKSDLTLFELMIEKVYSYDSLRKKEILQNLGIRNNTQEGNLPVSVVLCVFCMNMNDQLRAELIEKGINAAIIDRIIQYTDSFSIDGNETEILTDFGTDKEKNICEVLNEIYDEVMAISLKISGQNSLELLKKDDFIFENIVLRIKNKNKVFGV